MNNKECDFRSMVKGTNFIFCLIVLVLLASSCTPLRKKFTREKKVDKENDPRFIPVLDPIDYPVKVTLSEDQYKQHYSLWKVWDKDLLQNIEMDSSEKRQKYLLSQSIAHLDEMAALLSGTQQVGLVAVTKDYRAILLEYEKPISSRNKNALKRMIVRSGKEVRTKYTPRLLESYWKKEQSTGATNADE